MRRGSAILAIATTIVCAAAATAGARTVRGRVLAERGPVAGAVVAWGHTRFATTDAAGRFALDVDGEAGIVWARVPEGFVPGPAFARVAAGTADAEVAIALRALAEPVAGPLTFVVASDTHVTAAQPFSHDLRDVATEAVTSVVPAPAFFTILGDVTQGAKDEELALVDEQLAGLGVPYVPVPGNHDWYDGGDAWFAHYGPDDYAFDVGGVHVVVWNMAMPADEVRAYLGLELAHVDRAMPIVALTHAPPVPEVLDALRDLGVDYVLTGHTHTNFVLDHDGVIELNTEPLLMGGLDDTPAGYRVVTIDPHRIAAAHRAVVAGGVAALLAPRGCARGGDPIVVAASAGRARVTIDCGTPLELAPAGGWDLRGALPVGLAPGVHELRLDGGAPQKFAVCAGASGGDVRGAWEQLGGDAAHRGATAREVVPPLATRWTATVGGHVAASAPPVVGGGIVVVVASDLADGTTGAIVALDLATGAVKWTHAPPAATHGGAAIAGDVVAVPLEDGTLLGLDLATGAERWRAPVGEGLRAEAAALLGTPAVDDGELVVTNEKRFAAIDRATGGMRWAIDPMPADPFDFVATSSVAVGGGLAIAAPARALAGVVAVERTTGAEVWRWTGYPSAAVNGSPVIDEARGAAIVVDGADEVTSLDLATGAVRWQAQLDPEGFEWGAAIAATPAIARDAVIVPTLYGDVVALDAASGAERWRGAASAASPLRTTHYRGGDMRGFAASPVVTGDLVWTIDTAGELAARMLDGGEVVWRTALGVPVLAGPAVVGDALVVAGFDGSVRLLGPAPRGGELAAAPTCSEPARRGGCCAVGGGWGGVAPAFAVLAWLLRRSRVGDTAR